MQPKRITRTITIEGDQGADFPPLDYAALLPGIPGFVRTEAKTYGGWNTPTLNADGLTRTTTEYKTVQVVDDEGVLVPVRSLPAAA